MEPDKKKKIKFNLFLNRFSWLGHVLIFLIVISAGVYFLVVPEINKARQITKEFLPTKAKELELLDQYDAKIVALENLSAQAESQNSRSMELLKQVLPSTSNVPELIAQLEALTKKSGFFMGNLSISESIASPTKKATTGKNQTVDSNLRSINISLSLTGGEYASFKALLDNIEKNVRLLDINSISFSVNEGVAGGYLLNLKTYYLESK